MAQKKREFRSISDLTDKQKKFIDILVEKWGKITKTDALIESGYNTKTRESAMVLASKLTNPDINPHVCRYLEKKKMDVPAPNAYDNSILSKTGTSLINGTKGRYKLSTFKNKPAWRFKPEVGRKVITSTYFMTVMGYFEITLFVN